MVHTAATLSLCDYAVWLACDFYATLDFMGLLSHIKAGPFLKVAVIWAFD